MMDNVKFRWVDGRTCDDQDWERIVKIVRLRGWVPLPREFAKVRIAEDTDGKLLGFLVLQLIPHAEPLFVAPAMRATGLAEELSDQMDKFLIDNKITGYLATADSPFAAQICEKHGMTPIANPVYIKMERVTKEN